MPDERTYRVTLQELEDGSRVLPEDQVEVVDATEAPHPDSRGPQPDRDWFAAGG